MSRLWLALVLSGTPIVAFAAEAQPPSAIAEPRPADLAVARDIVAIMLPPDKRSAIFLSTMRNISAQMKQATLPSITDAGLRKVVEDKIDSMPGRLVAVTDRHAPMMVEAIARAYTHEFDAAELREILAFARTKAGTHYLSRSAALMADPDVAAVNRAYFADALVVQKQLVAELGSEVQAYIAKHPGAAPTKP